MAQAFERVIQRETTSFVEATIFVAIMNDEAPGVDSTYHIQTNVSIRRGIIWGINIHNIYT